MTKKKGKGILLKIALFVFLAAAIIKPISLQIQIHDLQKQSKALDQQISTQETVNQDLKDSLDEGITGETIAKIARDVLGYVSPGERVFKDSSAE